MTSICGPNEALKRPINCEIIYYEIAQKNAAKSLALARSRRKNAKTA